MGRAMSPLTAIAMVLLPLAAAVATTPVRRSDRAARQAAPGPQSVDESAVRSSRVARQAEPDIEPVGIQSADIYVVRRTNSTSAPTVNPVPACNASGYDTEFGSPFTFKCGPNYALTTIRSTYCSAPGDRAWKYSCTYMGLGHQECYWSPFVNDAGSVLFYQCPFNSIVTGFYSEFDASQNDRRWKVKCCRTEKSILYNCQNSLPANTLTEDLKFTVFGNYFLRGVLATFKRNVRRGEIDRRFQFVTCRMTSEKSN
ncbi:hemagglutinin/amebocyte aggregation factor-like [Branchiostoma floridae x Branchiostoma belcheri]